MKKKIIISLISIFALVLAVLTGLYVNYNLKHPTVLTCNIDPSKVSAVYIYGGITDLHKTTNRNDIDHIVKNINKLKLKRGLPTNGFNEYNIAVYMRDKDKKILWEGCYIKKYERVLNGKFIENNTIIYNDYFYADVNSTFDYDFVENLKLSLPKAYDK